tara:strand:+ start:4593 stop:7283 length:2691 start_codon:yes stop_codon:yes gene_type:complete
MATYVNDLRLKEISTGDESGTWGTSTNTNLELIGEALGYATEQSFGSDADATTTVADGASDPARAMYFKVTSAGSLTATRTLTIAPNTVSRVMFIENATSGSQSIAISQGSGANVTIATGKTAIVYLDGAGSGAAVVDAMAGVDPGVTDTLAEVLTAGNTSSGTNIELTTTDKVQFRDSAIYINSSADGQLDIVADTEVQIAATTVDINGNVDISGAVTAAGLTVSNSSLQVKLEEADGTNNPRLVTYFDSSGTHLQHTWSSNASNLIFEVGGSEGSGTERMRIDESGNVGIGTASPSSYLPEGSNLVIADSSHAGITVASGASSEGGIFFADGTSGSDRFRGMIRYNHASNYMEFRTDAGERMRINAAGNVGIGTSSPDTQLTLFKSSTNADVDYAKMRMDSWGGSTGKLKSIVWDDAGNNVAAVGAEYDGSKTNIHFHSQYNGAFKGTSVRTMSIMGDGKVGIGTSSPSAKLTVVGTTKVGEGAASNTSKLMVNTASGTAAGIQLFQDSVESWIIDNPASSTGLTFSNSGTERMRIDGSGNVSVSSSAGLVENAIGVFMLPAGELRVKDSTEDGTAQISTYNNNVTSDAQQFFVGNNLADVDIGNKRGALKFFANSTTERMRIDTSGNLTVGNTNAGAAGLSLVNNYNLSFSEGSNLSYANVFRQASSAAAVMGNGYKYSSTANKMASSHSSAWARTAIWAGYGAIKFYADAEATVAVGTDITPTERMRLDSEGSLHIGRTSNVNTSQGLSLIASGEITFCRAGDLATFNRINSDGDILRFRRDNVAKGSVSISGNTTSYNQSSDRRLKENIADADDAGSKVDAIQVRKFDWISDGEHQDYGMIAQELKTVAPLAVTGNADSEEMMSVDYSKLVPMLVKEIQSLRSRVHQLENS